MIIVTLALIVMVSMPTVAIAGATKGQKIFKKKFRKKCRFSGVRFARNHTQAEWEEIYETLEDGREEFEGHERKAREKGRSEGRRLLTEWKVMYVISRSGIEIVNYR